MAADIMAPPTVAGVGSVGGEIRLKVKGAPAYKGIAGKSEGIPVRSDTAVS